MQRFERRLRKFKVLIVYDKGNSDNAPGRAARKLTDELKAKDVIVIESFSADDGQAIITSDPSIDGALIDWDLDKGDEECTGVQCLIHATRCRNAEMPIFLLAERTVASSISKDIMKDVTDFVWLLEDSPAFIAGRVLAAVERYREELFPPFSSALALFSQVYEYSWHTPGHTGGTAFMKSPVGIAFHEAFGEPMFRSDLSISVGELGSLLDHSGPIGESEKFAARVFGAHRSYTVTNGTSTSNRIIFTACVTQDEVALVDRNCHKSLEHGMTLTGCRPVFLTPCRNYLGIIGPIHPETLEPEAIADAIGRNRLAAKAKSKKPVLAVITNSTYDGLTYNVKSVLSRIGGTVPRIHFDEAWYGYARFNPIYADRFAMFGDPKDWVGPTVFATHSTHKLLAALSQASFIHVRDGKQPMEHGRFNEAFMMHSSTSPLYSIIASNEISAAMMDGPGGLALTTESIQEAVAFRKMIARIKAEYDASQDWFFSTWQADSVEDPGTGQKMRFEDASDEFLSTDPDCWVLHPGDDWHGFPDMEDGYCMLDPIKVSVVTPGMSREGKLERNGIPATVLTAYLDELGIVAEKTTDFTILFLFSIGITKGKWGTLVNALLSFKEDYDTNAPLSMTLPALVGANPQRYGGMGLKDLSDQMFREMAQLKTTEWMDRAFSQLPEPDMTPRDAYVKLVHNRVAHLPLDKLAHKVVATGVVPYPPGIPLMVPGENFGDEDGPYLSYMRALEAFDRQFPGFGHDTHGVEVEAGSYRLYGVK